MSEEPIKYPYVADLPRKVRIEGELGVEEFNLNALVALAKESSQQRDELTEICQIYGHPLYVRLDWRDPEIAMNELERIRATLKDMVARVEGYANWQAKEVEAKEARTEPQNQLQHRVEVLEQKLSEQGINELAQAIERRIVSRLKYGRDPRIEASK